MSGRTLNCEDWLNKTYTDIVGTDEFIFDAVCVTGASMRLKDADEVSLVLKAKGLRPSPSVSNAPFTSSTLPPEEHGDGNLPNSKSNVGGVAAGVVIGVMLLQLPLLLVCSSI